MGAGVGVSVVLSGVRVDVIEILDHKYFSEEVATSLLTTIIHLNSQNHDIIHHLM